MRKNGKLKAQIVLTSLQNVMRIIGFLSDSKMSLSVVKLSSAWLLVPNLAGPGRSPFRILRAG